MRLQVRSYGKMRVNVIIAVFSITAKVLMHWSQRIMEIAYPATTRLSPSKFKNPNGENEDGGDTS